MTAGKTALIIGGGITGPVAAIALRKAGIEATIYEAYDKRADNVGGVLFIGTNGLDALAAIDVLEATHGHGLPTPRVSIYNGGGKLLCTTPTSLPLADGITTTSFKRAELYRVLHQEAARRGIRTELGKRLTRITESTDSITAHFADGTEASADILIGADGIRSTVREIIDPAASKPRYTGLVAFAGFAPNPALPPDRDTYKMAFGKNAFFWYFVPDPRQAWWEVNMPSKEPLSREQILAEGIDTWSRRLIQLFQEDKSPAAQILGAQGEDLLCIGAQYDLPSARSWHRGRMAIVGDAAHAVSPSSGQGASMAVESAVTLARCLRDCINPDEAFRTYERLRRNRVDRVLAFGAKRTASKAVGPFTAFLRDSLHGLGLRHLYQPEADAWLLRHHIDWDSTVKTELAAAA